MPRSLLDLVTQRLKNAIKAGGLKETALRLSYRKGFPLSIDPDRLSLIVAQKAGDSIKSVTYRQMSGWKKSGAYRLVIRTKSGKKLSLVFKNALYSQCEIPALEALPITPGLGEFTFFKNMNENLAQFLPEVFSAEEVIPKEHYQYIMEDLTTQHRSFAGEADIVTLCDRIHDIHAAFNTLASHADCKELPIFDYNFAKRLFKYGKQNLAAYQQIHPVAEVKELIDSWRKFESAYNKHANLIYNEQSLILIHGDYNVGNAMYPCDGGTIKIIDLEWTGWGLPHHDLAVALNRASKSIEAQCIESFSRHLGPGRLETDLTIYRVCRIERALLDAAFIAKQTLDAEARTPTWFPEFIARSCRECLDLSRALNK